MPSFRHEIEERLEGEAAFEEARVRNDQVRLFEQDVLYEEHVEIERSRAESLSPDPPETPLDRKEGSKEGLWSAIPPEAYGRIEVEGPWSPDGVRFVQRRERERGRRDFPEGSDGTLEGSLPVPEVRSES